MRLTIRSLVINNPINLLLIILWRGSFVTACFKVHKLLPNVKMRGTLREVIR